MPTIIVYHDVSDTDTWLASPKREEVMGPLGVSNIRTFVNPDARHKVGLVMDVPDLDALMGALANPPAEFVEAMQHDTVQPETITILVES
ncbi:MAG TPA: hypothetical protein VE570_10325 [Thermoleophilaceae bacterium]|jgi:hypothetical protein|nr:hypothetical protein [Thermoleophilaceae bacterium]